MARILSVRSKGEKTVLVTLDIEIDGIRKKYTVSEGTYREIGCPLSGEEIDEEFFLILSTEDEKRRALAKSLNVLSYADNNKRALTGKLLRAGFSREAIEYAVTECVMRGYIDEARQAERLIMKHYAELLGPHKIKAKLQARQFSSALISKALCTLEEQGEIDFKENRARLLREKLGADASYDEKMKLLYKYGYLR